MAIGLGQNQGEPQRERRQAGRRRDVAAAAEHGIGAALGEQLARSRNGRRRQAESAGGADRVRAVEAADTQQVDLVSGLGHQAGLRAVGGAEKRDVGALSAKRVGYGQRRNDVPRRSSRRYDDPWHLWLCSSPARRGRPSPRVGR